MSCTKWRLFIGSRKGDKEIAGTEWIVLGKVTLLWTSTGICQVDYLTGANQNILDSLIKLPFLGETQTSIKLGINSQFSDVGFAQVTPFWVCCFFFNMGQRNLDNDVRKGENHIRRTLGKWVSWKPVEEDLICTGQLTCDHP